METFYRMVNKSFASVERLRYFALDAFVVCILFLPALAAWTVIGLGFFGFYDFQAKNLKTERVLMLDSNEFQQAVDERIDELVKSQTGNKKYKNGEEDE